MLSLSDLPDLPAVPDTVKTTLSFAWTAYIAILAVWIVLQKRSPLSTLSWILSMAWLPVLGFGVYYFFGPQRMRRQRIKRIRSHANLYAKSDFANLRTLSDHAPQHLQQMGLLGHATCDIPVSTASDVRLLVGGAQTYNALFEAIRAARHHVHLEYYIFEPDKIGTALRDLLVEKARQGVKVRLLVDALGSKRLGKRFFAPLEAAGAGVGLFHDSRIGRRLRPVINFRTHRKIVVCDGEVGFTGGLNITDEEDERTRPDAYHDVHLRLEGNAVRWLQMVFMEDWVYATGERKRRTAEDFDKLLRPTVVGEHAVQIVASGPDSAYEAIHRMVLAAINGAVRRVWIATPYFVPGSPTLMALTSAALRGVDVRVMVPMRSDSRIVSAAARSYFDELIEAGAKVWEYEARMLHSKTMVFDDDCGVVGTANFDNRSFRLNYEICAFVYGPTLTVPLGAQFERDLRKSVRVEADRHLPAWQKLFDATARLFSPLL
ncbi:cardiolipin synthase [Xylophilus sp. Leaf220]|uniref:cardiolipin synthase n=1 Tax=Xylophilus sp. Leaf220 TaxID=1735686 RepID=UPI0006FBD6D6|nr:cardiolipin synthase [Xylophilus sp. Leaf220]KQM75349.1 cardiolipin synthase [Xylophilus sp. Leaf220]